MILYPIGASGETLILTRPVLEKFEAFRQRRWQQREAGGQLFARFVDRHIVVEEATGPNKGDVRSRYAFRPNRRREQRDILKRYARGLHFVGDWHTHPERLPRISARDHESMRELVSQSKHGLNGFVLVIAGTGDGPAALSVSVFDRTSYSILNASRWSPAACPDDLCHNGA